MVNRIVCHHLTAAAIMHYVAFYFCSKPFPSLPGVFVSEQTIKERILVQLSSGNRVSGQALADAAGISRTAVWKHIRGLRELGFALRAESGQGYQLDSFPDILHPLAVRPGLDTHLVGAEMHYRKEVDSTQSIAGRLAAEGSPEGTVVLTGGQRSGRGRRGRQWHFLPGGIALSVVFRPSLPPDRIAQFPLLAGVAAAEAVASCCGAEPGLKWPNDLFLGDKKFGGILAEMASDAEGIRHVILGLGLNVNAGQEDIPISINETATSILAVTGKKVPRPVLTRALLNRLENYYFLLLHSGFAPVRKEWIRRNVTLGHRVRADTGKEILQGVAGDIDEYGRLLLQEEKGGETRLLAGDISLRT